MTKNIPIARAKEFAIANKLSQVIIFGFDHDRVTHVITWGDTEEACAQAAAGANKIKKGWDWPEDTIVESKSVAQLKARIAELEQGLLDILNEATEAKAMCDPVSQVYVVEVTEMDFGQRPEGILAFGSEAGAKAYIHNQTKDRTGPAPESYLRYDYLGAKTCSRYNYQRVMNSRPAVYFDNLQDLLKGSK